MNIENASQFPRTFYCKHMQPGIARYEEETILVDVDGMKNLISSVGKRSIPVYINHQDVDLKNIKHKACGYVCDSFYNQIDGWAWFKFIAVDDEAHEAIKKGWAVSNAYLPTEWGPAGTKNNCPYKREVRNGEFTHLAIVPDPRYEGACIMTPEEFINYQDENKRKLAELQNSKGAKPMFKLFKTKREEITNASDIDADTMIELANGKSANLQEMINALEAKAEPKKFMVNGVEMTAEEIANAYTKLNGKKGMKKNEKMEKDEDEVDAEGDQDEEGDDEIGTDKKNKMKKNKKMKKNSEEDDCMSNDMEGDEEEDKEQENKKQKKNSKNVEVEVDDRYFEELRNAHLTAPKRAEESRVVVSIDAIERGKQRYGSAK